MAEVSSLEAMTVVLVHGVALHLTVVTSTIAQSGVEALAKDAPRCLGGAQRGGGT